MRGSDKFARYIEDKPVESREAVRDEIAELTAELERNGGAIHRVPVGATAFQERTMQQLNKSLYDASVERRKQKGEQPCK